MDTKGAGMQGQVKQVGCWAVNRRQKCLAGNWTQGSYRYRLYRLRAFTLIELLTVIAVISILLAVLVPSLARARGKSQRVVCQNNIRLFHIGLAAYADEYNQRLLSNPVDAAGEHVFVLSAIKRTELLDRIGHNKILECPWLGGPFKSADGWYRQEINSYIIGYNYLGGRQLSSWPVPSGCSPWKSPQKITDRLTSPVITEMNDWLTETSELRTFAPHGTRGPVVQFAENGKGGISSRQVGAIGGNLGYLDGSVRWKDISDMTPHLATTYNNSAFGVW